MAFVCIYVFADDIAAQVLELAAIAAIFMAIVLRGENIMAALIQLVCPHCRAINRLPNDKLYYRPKCGACHQALFNGLPLSLDAAGFERHVQHSQIPMVVDFWADWCGPCKMMAPVFAQVTTQLEPEFRFAKINTDQQPELSARFNIRSIPTLIVFRNGLECARQSGALSAQEMLRWLRNVA